MHVCVCVCVGGWVHVCVCVGGWLQHVCGWEGGCLDALERGVLDGVDVPDCGHALRVVGVVADPAGVPRT